jgi:thioredoxin 1
MNMAHVVSNVEEFKNLTEKGVVLIDFYADWCGPCRMVGPIVEEIAHECPDVLVGKVNVDEEQELASAFSVMSIPTLVVMRNGEVVTKSTGAKPKAAIMALIDA